MMLERLDTKLAGFVFKGQLASCAVQELTSIGKSSAEARFEGIASKVSLALLEEEAVAAARKMSAVYIAMASFENMVRDLVASRLLEVKGANWWEQSGISTDVKKRAETRMEQEKQIRWHQARGLSPIYFTELGDLPSIINGNWPLFEDLLRDIEWVRHIIKTIERSRNVIMHSGQLSMDDIERVGVSIRDWLRQVGG
jgi:hypothetical protein